MQSRQESHAVTGAVVREFRNTRAHRVGNAIVSGLARAGIGPFWLLTTRGRKTGRPHTNPVTLVEQQDGTQWLVAPYGTVSWVRNARAPGESASGADAAVRLSHPRGRTRRSCACPQALHRGCQCNATVLPGKQELSRGGLRGRGGTPPRVRTHPRRHIACSARWRRRRADAGRGEEARRDGHGHDRAPEGDGRDRPAARRPPRTSLTAFSEQQPNPVCGIVNSAEYWTPDEAEAPCARSSPEHDSGLRPGKEVLTRGRHPTSLTDARFR